MYTLYYSPGTASLCVHQALIEVLSGGPHADALVAEHAKAGDRVAGTASVCRGHESSPELEEALCARRTERVDLMRV